MVLLLYSEPFTFVSSLSKGLNVVLYLQYNEDHWIESTAGQVYMDVMLHLHSHPIYSLILSVLPAPPQCSRLTKEVISTKQAQGVRQTRQASEQWQVAPSTNSEFCFSFHLFVGYTWSTSCFSKSCSCLWKPMLGLAQDLAALTTDSASSQPKSVMVMMYATTNVTLLETPARLHEKRGARNRWSTALLQLQLKAPLPNQRHSRFAVLTATINTTVLELRGFWYCFFKWIRTNL